jgi:uncharacterized protein
MQDMKTAMKQGDTERRDVIRYLRSALGNREIELHRELTDEDVLSVIRTQIKQSSDAAEIFRDANRTDLAEKEERQVEILREYLPEQLSEDELEILVRQTADETGARGPADMGKLMPRLLEVVGGRAEGREVSRLAREELQRRAS